jgi:regulator of extracellular matrix RemA (YlzA/DUF370 family)
MDFLKQGAENLKSLGFGAAVPELRDRILNVVSPDSSSQEAIVRKVLQEEEQKRQKMTGMKKGGKVSSASKRADGCAIRGKTRA